MAELGSIRPEMVICLGVTVARALLGPGVKVLRDRGKVVATPEIARAFVTVYPSMLLRIPDWSDAHKEYDRFVRDLRRAAAF